MRAYWNYFHLLELLLGADGAGVSALLLATIGGTGVKTCVTLAADHLVAVVFLGQHTERRLNDTTTQTKDEMEGRLLLDVVVRKGTAVLQLLTSKDQTLLIWWDALFVLDFGFDIFDSVRSLNF